MKDLIKNEPVVSAAVSVSGLVVAYLAARGYLDADAETLITGVVAVVAGYVVTRAVRSQVTPVSKL